MSETPVIPLATALSLAGEALAGHNREREALALLAAAVRAELSQGQPTEPVAKALTEVDAEAARYEAAGFHGTDEYVDALERLVRAVRAMLSRSQPHPGTVTITEDQLAQVIRSTPLGHGFDSSPDREEIPGMSAALASRLFRMLAELPRTQN
jgi:hypothetical protein